MYVVILGWFPYIYNSVTRSKIFKVRILFTLSEINSHGPFKALTSLPINSRKCTAATLKVCLSSTRPIDCSAVRTFRADGNGVPFLFMRISCSGMFLKINISWEKNYNVFSDFSFCSFRT